jgi:carbohydrate-binding DOMON domain-containing protein
VPSSSDDYPVTPDPKCDQNNPVNARVINFINNEAPDAAKAAAATGLSSDFILAWAGYESYYGSTRAATVNNTFYGLTNGNWTGAVACPPGRSPVYVCFADSGLFDSAVSALTSFGNKYLKAALAAQSAGDDIAAIAQAIADAGFNSEYDPGVYGSKVNDAAQAIGSRKDCP